jgi:hypothetical protein
MFNKAVKEIGHVLIRSLNEFYNLRIDIIKQRAFTPNQGGRSLVNILQKMTLNRMNFMSTSPHTNYIIEFILEIQRELANPSVK